MTSTVTPHRGTGHMPYPLLAALDCDGVNLLPTKNGVRGSFRNLGNGLIMAVPHAENARR